MVIDLQAAFIDMLAEGWTNDGPMTEDQFAQLQAAFFGGVACAVTDLPIDHPHREAINIQLQKFFRQFKAKNGLA
ncbi:hypothetical protein Plim_4281 (plasmid) [Planctopirus limnophila DSM 3776]|uniref:Uncharacterized protein n=1 Tax=Planctopirus limnophila (strain ATCC 43296 / DSM 3776 / IFAM 1008 / Mu 290) TaxID=521674 RepID=D5SZG8_PLAL2|nr:hypothetical protein [Planctopirus limnophila]ADG70088.1 hypothetical protein Plim_4281 [Planctopirus limnophila DSM 3776]